MQTTQNKLRLIWADKIALSLAVLIVAIPAIGWALVALAAGPLGANHVLASIGADGAIEVLATVLALWASLRAIDFLAGGATYKLFHTEEKAASASSAREIPGGNLLAH